MPTAPAICPVCLCALLAEDNLGNPGCGHVFHKACIEEWFRVQNNRKCPHCRNSSKAAKINPIYLQFDEHPSFIASPSRDAHSASASNSTAESDKAQVLKELDKLKSEYNNYKSKMEREKKEREQSFEFLKYQMTSLESEVENKSRQHSIIASRLKSTKESLEQMKSDLQRKTYKIEDLKKEIKSTKERYERDVEHPCMIRTLLQSKSSEIRKRVQDYSQMGEHGMQILAEFAVAANEESKGLRSQLREVKIECDLLKRSSLTVSSSLTSNSTKVRSTSSNILKRASTNSDEANTSQSSSSFNDSDRGSNKRLMMDMESCEGAALDNEKRVLPTCSSVEKTDTEPPIEEATSASLNTKKAFLPVNEGDDDILMEQTIIESPQFRNPLTKVRGSLLSRSPLRKSSKRLSIMRPYNGLGSSSTKLFQPRWKF